jgi:hypothetical protein
MAWFLGMRDRQTREIKADGDHNSTSMRGRQFMGIYTTQNRVGYYRLHGFGCLSGGKIPRAHPTELRYNEHMGVQLYILNRHQVPLVVAGTRHLIGTLRRSWKLTEIDTERAMEISAAQERLIGYDTPVAAMVAEIVELPLLGVPGYSAAAHVVIGWEPDRYSVTDMAWDFLPVLGFAVRAPDAVEFVLHQEQEGGLVPMTAPRAVEMAVLDGAGHLLQRGQPSITKCLAVKPLIKSYAVANCELADGRAAELVTELQADDLPPTSWYIGKQPSQTKVFFSGNAARF